MNSNYQVREQFSMDKGWRFHLGDVILPYGSNHKYCYSSSKAGGSQGPARDDWNNEDWEWVDLPHDWSVGLEFDPATRAPHGFKQRGIGWYRKQFRLDEADRKKQLLLEFDGIATYSAIYFNGSVINRNWCGYTSFSVDISDRAFYGDRPNTLAIRVDAEAWEGWWYEGAEIYRHVWLTKKLPLHIAYRGIWVNPGKKRDDTWDTFIETIVENSTYEDVSCKLVSSIIAPDGKLLGGAAKTEVVCPGGEEVIVNQVVELENPYLWDIDSPDLYTLVRK